MPDVQEIVGRLDTAAWQPDGIVGRMVAIDLAVAAVREARAATVQEIRALLMDLAEAEDGNGFPGAAALRDAAQVVARRFASPTGTGDNE